jgi:hypothetical protein
MAQRSSDHWSFFTSAAASPVLSSWPSCPPPASEVGSLQWNTCGRQVRRSPACLRRDLLCTATCFRSRAPTAGHSGSQKAVRPPPCILARQGASRRVDPLNVRSCTLPKLGFILAYPTHMHIAQAWPFPCLALTHTSLSSPARAACSATAPKMAGTRYSSAGCAHVTIFIGGEGWGG